RIDKKIKFEKLSREELKLVIKNTFKRVISTLKPADKEFIERSSLQEQYIAHRDTFINVRMLDKFIENDVYTLLLEQALQH
ncbi:MAG: ATP-dependent Clp protease ATP-binding subunit, partial [Liquorilactobacillus satsumensis]